MVHGAGECASMRAEMAEAAKAASETEMALGKANAALAELEASLVEVRPFTTSSSHATH